MNPVLPLAVLNELLAPYISSGQLILLTLHKIEAADVVGDRVKALKAVDTLSGNTLILSAPYFIDATELGDLLPITGTEYVTGAESRQRQGNCMPRKNLIRKTIRHLLFALPWIMYREVIFVIEKPGIMISGLTTNRLLIRHGGKYLISIIQLLPPVPKELGFNPEGYDDPSCVQPLELPPHYKSYEFLGFCL